VSTREPGGSAGAEQIRNLLVRGKANRWDPLTETMLMFAARADHVAHTIKPALRERRWVISDRFTDSTYAYQGAGRGIPRETIRRVEAIALGDFRPDLTLILDLPVEEGLARARDRGSQEDRFEHFDRAFHERLRAAFLAIAKRAPDRCRLIDASGSKDDVSALIYSAVRKHFRIR
jgi:dTMP kinase